MTGEEVRTVDEKREPGTGRPKVLITLIEKRGPCGCHRGHKVGDAFDFDRDRGKLCPMALHAGFLICRSGRFGATCLFSRCVTDRRPGEIIGTM